MAKKKRKCQPQNYQCGRICIKGVYVCHVDGLTGQSVSIANKLVEAIKTVKPKIEISQGQVEFDPDNEEMFIKSIVDGNSVKTSVMFKGIAEDEFLEVNFSVNDKKSRASLKNQNTSEAKREIIKQVIKDYNSMFDRFPEGAVVTAVPYNDDGLGNKRAKLYKRMGFKPNLKEPLGRMIAVKKDGKLQ